jgi:hypothetical protein
MNRLGNPEYGHNGYEERAYPYHPPRPTTTSQSVFVLSHLEQAPDAVEVRINLVSDMDPDPELRTPVPLPPPFVQSPAGIGHWLGCCGLGFFLSLLLLLLLSAESGREPEYGEFVLG